MTGERGPLGAERLEESLVNLAEWEHSSSEDVLDAWRALAGRGAGEGRG